MQMNHYQSEAAKTSIYPKLKTKDDVHLPWVYAVIGLSGECGEIAEKFKKIIRDKGGVVSNEDKHLITKELGDVMWYLANIAKDLNIKLNTVAKENIKKLKSRKKRGKIMGSGDNR